MDLVAELVVLRLPVQRVDRDEKREEARPLDVPEELKAEPLPLVCPLDDALGFIRSRLAR
jgi:hypothetical protein